jgi:hypothetical protein
MPVTPEIFLDVAQIVLVFHFVVQDGLFFCSESILTKEFFFGRGVSTKNIRKLQWQVQEKI